MEVTCTQRLPTKHSNFEAKVLGQYTLAYIGRHFIVCMNLVGSVMTRPGSTFSRDVSVWIQTRLSGTGLS
jgi:hypothetical protein